MSRAIWRRGWHDARASRPARREPSTHASDDTPSSALRAPSPRTRGEGQQPPRCPSPRLRGEGGAKRRVRGRASEPTLSSAISRIRATSVRGHISSCSVRRVMPDDVLRTADATPSPHTPKHADDRSTGAAAAVLRHGGRRGARWTTGSVVTRARAARVPARTHRLPATLSSGRFSSLARPRYHLCSRAPHHGQNRRPVSMTRLIGTSTFKSGSEPDAKALACK